MSQKALPSDEVIFTLINLKKCKLRLILNVCTHILCVNLLLHLCVFRVSWWTWRRCVDCHREKSRPGLDTEGIRTDPAIPKSSVRPREFICFSSSSPFYVLFELILCTLYLLPAKDSNFWSLLIWSANTGFLLLLHSLSSVCKLPAVRVVYTFIHIFVI